MTSLGGTYSSQRQGMLEDRRAMEPEQLLLVDTSMATVWRQFVVRGVLSGALDISGFFADVDRYTACEWQPNGFPWIDPLKESKAIRRTLVETHDHLERDRCNPWSTLATRRRPVDEGSRVHERPRIPNSHFRIRAVARRATIASRATIATRTTSVRRRPEATATHQPSPPIGLKNMPKDLSILSELAATGWALDPPVLRSMVNVIVRHAEGEKLEPEAVDEIVGQRNRMALDAEDGGMRVEDGVAYIPIVGIISKRMGAIHPIVALRNIAEHDSTRTRASA